MAGRVGRDEKRRWELTRREMGEGVGVVQDVAGTMAAYRGGTVPDMQPTKGAVEPSCWPPLLESTGSGNSLGSARPVIERY